MLRIAIKQIPDYFFNQFTYFVIPINFPCFCIQATTRIIEMPANSLKPVRHNLHAYGRPFCQRISREFANFHKVIASNLVPTPRHYCCNVRCTTLIIKVRGNALTQNRHNSIPSTARTSRQRSGSDIYQNKA